MSSGRSVGFVRRLAWAALERVPQSAETLVRVARAQVLPRLPLRLPIYRLTGKTRAGANAALIFAGHWDDRDYIVGRLFAGPFERARIGASSVYALPGVLRRLRPGADLTIARIARPLAGELFGADGLRVPEAVDCEVVLSATPPALPLTTRSARHNAKNVRDSGLTWTVSHDLRDCDTFIATMYEPYIAARYGERSVRRQPYRVRRQFRRGGLLLVHQHGAPVAGATLIVDGPVMRFGVLGTIVGGGEFLQAGAVSALYVFGAEYARQLGLQGFNFGASHPSLADGVLAHKCRWGARIVDRDESLRDYVLGWNEPTEALLDLLAHTPLIVRDGGALSLLTAAAGSTVTEDLARVSKRAVAAGLTRVIALGERHGLPPAVWAVEHGPAERVRTTAYVLDTGPR